MSDISVEVEIWACPTPSCGNYYGASSAKGMDLNAVMNEMRVDDKAAHVAQGGSPLTHSRGECPDCRARGFKVPRQKITLKLLVPMPMPQALAAHGDAA